MKIRSVVNIVYVLVAIAATACATLVSPSAVHPSVSVQQAAPTPDYSNVIPPPYPKHRTYDPVLQPATSNPVKEITLHVQDVTTDVAPDVPVDLWTFESTSPGPALHVNLGDTVKFTLINEGQIEHSIDFHAAQTPWNINYKSIKPGEKNFLQILHRPSMAMPRLMGRLQKMLGKRKPKVKVASPFQQGKR